MGLKLLFSLYTGLDDIFETYFHNYKLVYDITIINVFPLLIRQVGILMTSRHYDDP